MRSVTHVPIAVIRTRCWKTTATSSDTERINKHQIAVIDFLTVRLLFAKNPRALAYASLQLFSCIYTR